MIRVKDIINPRDNREGEEVLIEFNLFLEANQGDTCRTKIRALHIEVEQKSGQSETGCDLSNNHPGKFSTFGADLRRVAEIHAFAGPQPHQKARLQTRFAWRADILQKCAIAIGYKARQHRADFLAH